MLPETNKAILPAIIAYQDRGRMSFPHRDLMPFCRRCSTAIKTWLNPTKYHMMKRKVIVTARRQVLSNTELCQDFTSACVHLVGSADESLMKTLFTEVVQRVVNTMAHSFFPKPRRA